MYHICDKGMLSFCLHILGVRNASALLICSLRGPWVVLSLVLLFTLPIFCYIFWVKCSDLLSPIIFKKVLKKFYFLLSLVPTVDSFCVWSMLVDKEMLMHQLSVVRFLSEGEGGEVILSTTRIRRAPEHAWFFWAVLLLAAAGLLLLSLWSSLSSNYFSSAQIPPEIFSAAVFLSWMPFHVSESLMLWIYNQCLFIY